MSPTPEQPPTPDDAHHPGRTPDAGAARSGDDPAHLGDDPPTPPAAVGQGRPDADGSPAPADDQDLLHRVDTNLERQMGKTTAEMNGLLEILGSRRRLITVNFLAGLSRGVGFFLGVTLIGGLVIGGLAFAIDRTAETLGYKDITFRRMMLVFAEKAREAKSVWEEVKDDPVTADGDAPPSMEAAPPEDSEGTIPDEGADGDDGG